MSLRRRVTVVFLLVNGATLLGLAFFIAVQTRRLRDRYDLDQSAIQDRTARLIGMLLKDRTEQALRRALLEQARRTGGGTALIDHAFVLLAVSDLDYWDDDELVRDHLDKAVLIRHDPVSTELFNPRPRLIFEAEDHIDRNEIRRLVERSKGVSQDRDARGRRILYGRIDLDTSGSWGFFVRLRRPPPATIDPIESVRVILYITIPGTIVLLAFIYAFFNRAVLRPLGDIERAANRIAAGDLRQPIDVGPRDDELAELARAMNRMMRDIAGYQDNLRKMVADATERFKRAERDLTIGRRLAAIGQLAAGFAHEINNPLSGLMNAVRMLGRPETDAARRAKYLNVAEASIERIRHIVRKVLDATPRQVEVKVVSLGEAVEAAIELIRHDFDKRRIAVSVDVPAELRVLGDHGELVQVFLNLLINARDAIGDRDDGAVAIRAYADDDGGVEIRIKDNGCGMSEEVYEKLFDLFFTTKPGGQGTGLGLGIVHGIVTGHDGTITVETEPGKGAEFVIRLPAWDGNAVG